MVYEARKQSMAWMETDYSKHTYFGWKIKWRQEHLGTLGIMGETALTNRNILVSRGTQSRGQDSGKVFKHLGFNQIEGALISL